MQTEGKKVQSGQLREGGRLLYLASEPPDSCGFKLQDHKFAAIFADDKCSHSVKHHLKRRRSHMQEKFFLCNCVRSIDGHILRYVHSSGDVIPGGAKLAPSFSH